uniref:Tetratricopeptide repeat domain 40 n=1 Tax=Pygocentrus nattereri TaxID=42514 RepID=A0A3B4C3W0_PYGNA
ALGCKEITEDCLMMYFESKPLPNQFLCRAYFCQAQLNSSSSVCTVEDMDKAVMYYLKAIEISKDNPRYHFLVFNASLLYFQTVRVFLRPGQRRHLVSSLTQVLSALEVVHEPDYAWRAELMLLLVECLVDAGKYKEAATFAKVTSDFIELHKPEMYPRIFSIQVKHLLFLPSFCNKLCCIFCSKARLAIVGRLDTLLQRAIKEGDGQVTQCVCASQWNSCLPLLQTNLRRSIKRPLLALAHALEDINSMLLDMRCQVHAELAAIEEEEQRLEPALKHLHTALGLDEKGQYQQHLSSSLHLLQLHTSIYTTPTRPEDQAAMLIQQAKEGSGCEPAKKWHPMLITAGIALAPDSFQMVLDADSAVKGSSPQGQGHLEQLAAKAQQHMTCVQRVEGQLASLERGTDDRERLWASLVKAARKQELWDVCRTACRFCLLYDDGRWKNKRELMNEIKPVEGKHSDHGVAAVGLNQGGERDLLRLLSEVRFICAEVGLIVDSNCLIYLLQQLKAGCIWDIQELPYGHLQPIRIEAQSMDGL